MEPQDARHREQLLAYLQNAAERFGVTVTGVPGFGWLDRTVGVSTRRPSGEPCWLRVVSEHADWVNERFWTGNVDSNVVTGLPKPCVLDWIEERGSGRWFRAELMTWVDARTVSRTPELHDDPDLPAQWFTDLSDALDVLWKVETPRVVSSQDVVTQRLREYFGGRIEPTIDYWVTSHADLHWANLTAPDLVVLDWESWGVAPFGYDVATLYCHSLLVPAVAAQIRQDHAELLDSPDGRRSQLLAAARILRRTEVGDYLDLVDPLHRLADQILGR